MPYAFPGKIYELENGTVTNNVPLIEEILNENVTDAEITFAIDNLKTRKSAGVDGIPAEFINACRDTLTPHITLAINNIIFMSQLSDRLGCRYSICNLYTR